MATCHGETIYIWRTIKDLVDPTKRSCDGFKPAMTTISESGIYASDNNCAVVHCAFEDLTPKIIESVKIEGHILEQLVACDGKAYLITKNKHIIVYVIGPEGIIGSKIDINQLTVTYDACTSPCGQFVSIGGREGGNAFLHKGKLLSVYVLESDKKVEVPIFLSNYKYCAFTTYNPNNTIRKSIHFLKWRTNEHI